MSGLTLFAFTSWMIFASVEAPSPPASLPLPPEPEESTRIDEIYDQESRLFLSLYSLKGNGEVDYVTGRTVQGHIRSNYGKASEVAAAAAKTDGIIFHLWHDDQVVPDGKVTIPNSLGHKFRSE